MCADFYASLSCTSTIPSQWSAFALVNAVTGAIVETLTNAMSSGWNYLLVVLGGALLLLNPLIALFAVGFFGVISRHRDESDPEGSGPMTGKSWPRRPGSPT